MLKTRHALIAVACTVAAAAAICFGEGLPDREPMRAAVLHARQEDGLVTEEVAFHWAERAYGFAHAIYAREPGARKAAVVVLPGRLGHYSRAAYRDLVREIARRDCLLLFVGEPHLGKRNAPEAGLHAAAAASGMPVAQIQAFDALRALDYLLTRPDVDPARIGLVGVDRGAEAALIAGAAERRFQFVVHAAAAAPPPGQATAAAGAEGRFRHVPLRAPGDAAAAARDIAAWIEGRIAKLPASDAAPLPCGKPEDPDFSMLRFVQRRIARQAASHPAAASEPAAWKARRDDLVEWLGKACRVEGIRPGAAKVIARAKQGALAVETLEIPIDADRTCVCRIVQQAGKAGSKRPAVILSHDGRQSISTPEIAEAAQRLASAGYCVILPEHASPDPKSLRAIDEAGMERFYRLSDQSGLSPLAARVVDDLAAFGQLAGRPDVDPSRIVAAGQGIGGIDACLAALLESRIAGVVSIDATTVRDWAEKAAPEEESFSGIMPYLPSVLAKADLDSFYAALAPRPQVLARPKEGWPKSGFQQVAAAASAAYRLQKSETALVLVSPREALDEREKRLPEGVQRQAVAVARSLLPAPPTPGVIGGPDLLKPRPIIDSATGVVWVVHVLGGVEQEFVDGGYRLATWSFVNNLGAGQKGRSVTPLIFKKEGDAYRLTGIGKTRANTGAGLQTFAFEKTQGSDVVGAGYFFGFYTGDPAGKSEAGVVPFDDGPRDRMTILTLDGQLGDQKVSLGKLYREHSSYPRTYSVQAISTRQ